MPLRFGERAAPGEEEDLLSSLTGTQTGEITLPIKEEQTKEIKLKIINQSYFPDIKNIEKLSKKNNKFYAKSNLDDMKDIHPSGNNQMNKKMDKNENRFSISIY